MGLRVIINADDLGMTPGVTKGIVDCMTRGVVSSATFMANMPSSREAAALAVEHGLAVGVHLNVTTGRPVSPASEVRTLVQSNGTFHSYGEFKRRLFSMRISMKDVFREFSAQIEATLEMGIGPTHIDTHHHTHLWLPVAHAMVRVGRKYGINKTRTPRTTDMALASARRPSLPGWAKRRYKAVSAVLLQRWFHMPTWRMEPSGFRGLGNSGRRSAREDWLFFADRLKEVPSGDLVEVPCHPAFVDDELRHIARYVEGREDEMAVLRSDELRFALAEADVHIVSFRDV